MSTANAEDDAARVDATIAARLPALLAAAAAERLVVAWSGGLDSSVLLASTAAWARRHGCPLHAVHVDHGLHPDSAAWAAQCRMQAGRLGVGLSVVRIEARPPVGASVEAWARQQRYRALVAHLDRDALLLTAHHADDQIETVLWRVLNGAGPHGLAGIAALRRCGPGHVGRPLLALGRADLAAWAARRELAWLEDPANRDRRHPRNRLRHDVLPALAAAWPAAPGNLLRLAGVQTALAGVLDDLADRALEAQPPQRLALAPLIALGPSLRPFVLKRWLARAGAPAPGWRVLAAIETQLVAARADAQPCLRYAGRELRRYAGHLYLLAAGALAPPPPPQPWDGQGELDLSCGRVRFAAPQPGAGIALAALADARIEIAFRHGGERCRPHGRGHSQQLKKLWQAWRVPPWERERTPLLYLDERLAAVGMLCVCAGFAAGPGELGRRLLWEPAWHAPAAAAVGYGGEAAS